ncbi:MAG: helix-turn-helix domain-containing protein, partial [Burkholderiaceae bacterium]
MEKLKPNIFVQACPSREIFSRISGKWTIMILLCLENTPKRFNELKKAIDGISQKVLTENLRSLERDGLILRKVISSRPIKVEYSSTHLNLELLEILTGLKDWTEGSMKLILRNNEKYDSGLVEEQIRRS